MNDFEEKVNNEELNTQEEKKDEEVINEPEIKEEEQKEEEKPTEKPLEPMESIVEVETVFDYRTLKYANMYVIKVKRKSFLISCVLASITLVAAILIAIFMDGLNKYMSIIIGGLSLFTIYNMIMEEKKIDKTLINFFRTHAKFTQVFAINNDKIRITSFVDGQERCADYSWPYIQEINAIPEYYFLFMNGGSPLVIDRAVTAFRKGTSEDLDQIIKDKAELKPYKFYNKPVVKSLCDNVQYYEPPMTDATVTENLNEQTEETVEKKEEDNE